MQVKKLNVTEQIFSYRSVQVSIAVDKVYGPLRWSPLDVSTSEEWVYQGVGILGHTHPTPSIPTTWYTPHLVYTHDHPVNRPTP